MPYRIEHQLLIHPDLRDRGSNPRGGKNYKFVFDVEIKTLDGQKELSERATTFKKRCG